MPKEERNLLKLDPTPVVFGALDPNYIGLLLPDSRLEKSDRASLLPDSVPEEANKGSFALWKIVTPGTRRGCKILTP